MSADQGLGSWHSQDLVLMCCLGHEGAPGNEWAVILASKAPDVGMKMMQIMKIIFH